MQPVRSVSEYLEIAFQLGPLLGQPKPEKDSAPEELWFRGEHGHHNFPLRPGLFRAEQYAWNAFNWERELTAAFSREAMGLLRILQADPNWWEVYHFMQHYGIPTRLLDWTESALTALYFALKTPPGMASSAHVWALNPYELNHRATGTRYIYETTPLAKTPDDQILETYKPIMMPKITGNTREYRAHPTAPFALLPPHVDRRITAQRSAFTMHGRDPDGLIVAARSAEAPMLVRIPMDSQYIENMRDELRTAGVTEATLFPDLEHLASDIKSTYYAPGH